MAEPSKTEQRKAEHVNIILQENVSAEYNYWNDVRLVHTALPEIDLDDVDVSEVLRQAPRGAPDHLVDDRRVRDGEGDQREPREGGLRSRRRDGGRVAARGVREAGA